MKKSVCFVLSVICLGLFVVPGSGAEYPDVTIEPFPIMSWIPPVINQEQIDLFRECGFTVISIKPSEDEYQQMKKYWNGNYFVADFQVTEFSDDIIDKYVGFHSEDPKKIGYFVADEPSAKKFPGFKKVFDKFRAKDSKRICFLNVLPNIVGESVLGASDYDDYLEQYFTYLAPRYSSFDYYPCLWFNIDAPGYYENLEEMRHYALKNKSKMLGFIQSFDSRDNRAPSESDMAWQIFSHLAYGAKGLWYFVYAHPLHLSTWKEGIVAYDTVAHYDTYPMEYQRYYRKGYNHGYDIIDFNDRPTALYHYTKKLNNEVFKWAPVLNKATSTRVRHVGNTSNSNKPVGTQSVVGWAPNKYEYIYAVQAADIRLDKGFVLGFFEDANTRPYVMLVNKRHGEFLDREGAKVEAIISFKNAVKKAFKVSSTTGNEEDFALDANKQSRVMLDGAILLRLEVDPNCEN